jgi:cytochrome P450 monooxygenase-1
MVNGRKFGELSNVRAKRDFAFGARQLLEKGLEMSPDKPFRIMGDVGELHILPPKYAYEVRNNEKLSFTMAAFKVRTRREREREE